MWSCWQSGLPATSSWSRTVGFPWFSNGESLLYMKEWCLMGFWFDHHTPGGNVGLTKGISKDVGRGATSSEALETGPGQQERTLLATVQFVAGEKRNRVNQKKCGISGFSPAHLNFFASAAFWASNLHPLLYVCMLLVSLPWLLGDLTVLRWTFALAQRQHRWRICHGLKALLRCTMSFSSLAWDSCLLLDTNAASQGIPTARHQCSASIGFAEVGASHALCGNPESSLVSWKMKKRALPQQASVGNHPGDIPDLNINLWERENNGYVTSAFYLFAFLCFSSGRVLGCAQDQCCMNHVWNPTLFSGSACRNSNRSRTESKWNQSRHSMCCSQCVGPNMFRLSLLGHVFNIVQKNLLRNMRHILLEVWAHLSFTQQVKVSQSTH